MSQNNDQYNIMIATKTPRTCCILHTADNHNSITFGRYAESIQGRLIEERFTALESIAATTNERKAINFRKSTAV
jgi:hypothetical protein